MNKRFFAFFLIPLLLASLILTACSSPQPEETEPTKTSKETILVTDPPLIHEAIAEMLVIDQEGILVRVKRLVFSKPEGPALIYEIENQSQEAIGSFFYAVSVNGIQIQVALTPWKGPKEENPYDRLPAGEKAEFDLIFPSEALERAQIFTIQEIELALYIMDSETKINLIDAQGIHIKTDADPSYIQTYDEEGILAHDSQDLKILVRLAETFPKADQTPDPALPLLWIYMVNKGEEERVILIEEMKINGTAVFNGFQSFLSPHKREYAYLYLDRQAQAEHDFESIEEISIRFQVRGQDFNQGPLYATDTISFTLEEDKP